MSPAATPKCLSRVFRSGDFPKPPPPIEKANPIQPSSPPEVPDSSGPESQSLLFHINRPPAYHCAAPAAHRFQLIGKPVIHRKLFTGMDDALAHIQDVAAHDLRVQVGIATVINDFRPTPADCSIDRPITVQCEQVRNGTQATPLGFAAADLFAGIFDHLAPLRDALQRKNPAPVDTRFSDL